MRMKSLTQIGYVIVLALDHNVMAAVLVLK